MVTEQETSQRTLESLCPGQKGTIARVAGEKGPVRRRLVDMGLTPGTVVTVRKTAPLGDPLELNLRGYSLSLRKEDARRILLLPAGETAVQHPHTHLHQGMVQRIPDDEVLRRMSAAHSHEATAHKSTPHYADHDLRGAKLALAGNPNCGKTTLFNALTGSNQYVGNWPGVTVEKKEGAAVVDGTSLTVVDLPGIYSLSPYSMEEVVARRHIVEEQPDAILNIVDATNLERNLYLTTQLLELEKPMVVALNFMDEARRHGDEIDCPALSACLGVPVVPITARSGENVTELLSIAHRQMHAGFTVEPDDLYDDYTHAIHHRIGELIHDYAYAVQLPAHWAAVKLLEGDALITDRLSLPSDVAAQVEATITEYESAYDLGDRETLVADSRYRFIQQAVAQSVKKGRPADALTTSDRIDYIVTHKVLAVPIFFLTMALMFSLSFGALGSALSDGVDLLVNGLFSGWVAGLLTGAGVAHWAVSLVVDGVIGGVGGVLTFLPQIALLFLFLSLLEDSGYMARAAFLTDRLLQRFGLSGKAFIPMLMGFGCTVPAILGARTMENEKDRRMTILLVPFMSCSARLPVYGLMTAAFFPRWGGLVVLSLYVLGLACAILSSIALRGAVFKGAPAPFVLELPPYRLPTLRNCGIHVWERVRGFLVKAGTLILAMSVVLWCLQSFGPGFVMVEDASTSFLGLLGGVLAPLLRPLGFGTWQAAVALLTGVIAKEAVVSSMSLFYGFSTLDAAPAIAAALSDSFATPAAAYSFLVFVLLYLPCVAALATLWKEMRSARWTALAIGWQLGCAWLVSFWVYRLALLLL